MIKITLVKTVPVYIPGMHFGDKSHVPSVNIPSKLCHHIMWIPCDTITILASHADVDYPLCKSVICAKDKMYYVAESPEELAPLITEARRPLMNK